MKFDELLAQQLSMRLHYRARRFYAPVTIGAQRSKGVTSVTLISDKRDALPARWRLRVIDRDGRMLSEVAWPPERNPLAFVCGPTPLVEAAGTALVGLGHDPARVKTERFGATGG